MLYQLSYASPAETDKIYRSGHQIASGFLDPQQNPCQQGFSGPRFRPAMPYCAAWGAGLANSESFRSTS